MAGAPNPDGKGATPNITPAKLTWSADEVVEYLTSGFTPEYDSVGGHMAHVVENMAKLPDSDRAAVAAYVDGIDGRLMRSMKSILGSRVERECLAAFGIKRSPLDCEADNRCR